jgi:hypothetical protein
MTIQIPDHLARGLEEVAAGQRTTAAQVVLERVISLLGEADLEAAIADSLLVVRHVGAFE